LEYSMTFLLKSVFGTLRSKPEPKARQSDRNQDKNQCSTR